MAVYRHVKGIKVGGALKRVQRQTSRYIYCFPCRQRTRPVFRSANEPALTCSCCQRPYDLLD